MIPVEAATHNMDGAVLELKLVGDITGQFQVPRYQRGYRWGQLEVNRLLDDIWESKGQPYSLQPVVVKRRSENDWELVDGQQRLTTLYLVFLYMQREGLQNAGPPYSLAYETRHESQQYLQRLDAERSDTNIDFFHLFAAYQCIRSWFDAYGPRRQYVANKFYGYLFESVRVIWYEAPHELDSITLFTRLNVGRIPLTDAELVKALLLSPSHGVAGRSDRAHEVAAQWDGIERDLRAPDVWAFVTETNPEDSPTRIALLLDTLAEGPQGRARPLFHTFDTLRRQLEESSPDTVWNAVVDLHALVVGWYDDRDLYHKIGYLVAVGHRFSDLVPIARQHTKRHFHQHLDDLIRRSLDLTRSGVTELSYEKDSDRNKCARVLLLMNVETVRQKEHSTERYSFHAHRWGSWSLEHIHAQNAESLMKVEQWTTWLQLHREALVRFPNEDGAQRDTLVAKIDALQDINRDSFNRLAREITEVFSRTQENGKASLHSVHSISNLALLSSGDNSALGNSVFEVKRRCILQLDRRGAYIPICTRLAFLKYYTDENAQQIHFWGIPDRERYLEAILSETNGGIGQYLKAEEREA